MDVGERLCTILCNGCGDVLCCAGERGHIDLRRPHDLGLVYRLPAELIPLVYFILLYLYSCILYNFYCIQVYRLAAEPHAPPLECAAFGADEQLVMAGTQSGALLVWALAGRAG